MNYIKKTKSGSEYIPAIDDKGTCPCCNGDRKNTCSVCLDGTIPLIVFQAKVDGSWVNVVVASLALPVKLNHKENFNGKLHNNKI